MKNDGQKPRRDRNKNGSSEKTPKKTPKTEKQVEKVVIANVFSANFSLIDDSIEELKKAVREYGVSHYACNNIYLFIQETLKRVKLSNN
jgi:hypothetical protein|tara:strand:+ start:36 stop:302 length:267 start_codon:yes stop_codon:yes gene_type:complete